MLLISRPPATILPSVGRSSPPIRDSSVDLPQPDGPMIATNSPGAMLNDTPRRAVTATSPMRWTRTTFVSSTPIGSPRRSVGSAVGCVDTGGDSCSTTAMGCASLRRGVKHSVEIRPADSARFCAPQLHAPACFGDHRNPPERAITRLRCVPSTSEVCAEGAAPRTDRAGIRPPISDCFAKYHPVLELP